MIVFRDLGEDGEAIGGDALGHVVGVEEGWNSESLLGNTKSQRIISERKEKKKTYKPGTSTLKTHLQLNCYFRTILLNAESSNDHKMKLIRRTCANYL